MGVYGFKSHLFFSFIPHNQVRMWIPRYFPIKVAIPFYSVYYVTNTPIQKGRVCEAVEWLNEKRVDRDERLAIWNSIQQQFYLRKR